MITYKICTTCKKEFEATTEFFNLRNEFTNQLKSSCRECDKKKYCVSGVRDYPGIKRDVEKFMHSSREDCIKMGLV